MATALSGSSAAPGANDLREALHVFIHDLRAPISVALGYLRLLRDDRLADEAARARALEQTVESLTRLSRLCDHGAELLALADEGARPVGRSALSTLVDRLLAGLAERGIDAEIEGDMDRRAVIDTARADELADRILLVVDWSARQGCGGPAHIEARDGRLRLRTGAPQARAALVSGQPAPIDWRRGGLGLPLAVACLAIERHGGRVWTTDGAFPSVSVTLPFEREPA
jgi:signal transduction histidine kinase